MTAGRSRVVYKANSAKHDTINKNVSREACLSGNNSVVEDTSYKRIVVGSIPTSPIYTMFSIIALEH